MLITSWLPQLMSLSTLVGVLILKQLAKFQTKTFPSKQGQLADS